MTRISILAALWAALLLALFIFSTPLDEMLWFLYLPIHWGIPLAGAVILVVAIVQGIRTRRPAPVAIVLSALGLVLFFTSGFRLGRLALFEIRKPHYEKLLAEAVRTGEVPRGSGYRDPGPPVRYAFYWKRGVIDNWAGVVYDPTGEVAKINRHSDRKDINDPTRYRLMGLFGGDLHHCERLRGDWYLCWFT